MASDLKHISQGSLPSSSLSSPSHSAPPHRQPIGDPLVARYGPPPAGSGTDLDDRKPVPLSKLDSWRKRLGNETIEKFEALAEIFSQLQPDGPGDIVGFNERLRRDLKDDEDLIAQYDAWSVDYFRPPSHIRNIADNGAENLRSFLRNADWNTPLREDNRYLVSDMMRHGHMLPNKGLFSLGCYQSSWLAVQLDPWVISVKAAVSQPKEPFGPRPHGGVLCVRYTSTEDPTTRQMIFFYPLGRIKHAESFPAETPSDFDSIEWKDTPYVLAVGVQTNGKTESYGSDGIVFYFIHYPIPESGSGPSHGEAEDSEDDGQDIDLCQERPPHTVARVEFLPEEFLTPGRLWMVTSTTPIELEILSTDAPEIGESGLARDKLWNSSVRTDLFLD